LVIDVIHTLFKLAYTATKTSLTITHAMCHLHETKDYDPYVPRNVTNKIWLVGVLQNT